MSPELSADPRNLIEAIDDLIAKQRNGMGDSVFGKMIDDTAEAYERPRHLPRLISMWPEQIDDETTSGCEQIIVRIASALMGCARLASENHWSYDLSRHIGLLGAIIAERQHHAELVAQENAKGMAGIFKVEAA